MAVVVPLLRNLLRSFLRDRSGNFVTMTAMIAPASIALAAIAIDFGSLYTQRRELQSMADLAAITAAAHLTQANLAVVTALADNGHPSTTVLSAVPAAVPPLGNVQALVEPGSYAGSAATPAASRFIAGQTPYNAVRVTLREQGRRYFGSALMEPPLISTHGVARVSAAAAFSVGSRLASLNGGLLNALLGGLLGGSISLQVMDYQALVDADVDLFSFLDALATEVHLTGATYTDLLASDVKVGQIASALANVPGLDNRSRLALRALSLAADADLTVKLAKVLDLGEAGYLSVGGHPAALSATANVLQLLTAGAAVANGDHQIALNLGASLPGLVSATLDLTIGEPAQHSSWFAIGETGSLVRTAQTRLLLTVTLLGPGGVLGTSVKLPIYIELAYAEAKLSKISCPAGSVSAAKVTISATPGVAELRIANIDVTSLDRFERSPVLGAATLVKVPAVTVTGAALVTISNNGPTKLDFTKADIDNGTVKTVSTRNPAQTLTASLLHNLTLTVKLAGIDLGLGALLKATLSTTLTAASPAVDQLLMAVLDTLGISVGEADIRVHGVTCGRAVLVQ